MADVSDLKNIPKFNGQNFQLWKFQIKAVLVAQDLLEIVEGTETKPVAGADNANATKVKEWTEKNAKAMFALSSSIDYSQLDYLVNCASPNEMWKKLSNIHEQKSTSNKLALTTKFHEYRKSPNDFIAQHVANIENIASQLKDIGQTVSDVMIMAKIISTLPSKYNAFISAWDSVPDTDQTMDKLRERLLREETRMSADDDIPRAFAATTIDTKNNGRKQPGDKKKSLVCNYCKKPGHIARYCFLKKRDKKSQKKENESSGDDFSRTTAFVMSQPSDNFKNNSSELESFHTSDTKNIWFLDSSASRHICCRRDWFSEFLSTRDDRVYMGNGAGLTVAGEGNVLIKRSVNRKWLDGIIRDVLTLGARSDTATPFELWFNKKPNVNHLRTFGCEAFALIPDVLRKKWDPKSKKLIFVGYEKDSENYRLFDPKTDRVVVSRHVKFNENSQNRVKPNEACFPLNFEEQPPAPVNDNLEVPEHEVEQPQSDDESFVDARDDHMPENLVENLPVEAELPAAIDDRAHRLKRSNADKCVYSGSIDNCKIYLALYVDDGVIFCKNVNVLNKIVKTLKEKFPIVTSDLNYFVGMEITRGENEIFVKQEIYIDKILRKFKMHDANIVKTPADPHVRLCKPTKPNELRVPYREAVGSLLFLALVSRPDIAYAVGVVSRYLDCFNETHWTAVKRIFRYIKGTRSFGILFRRSNEPLAPVGFSDADYAADVDTRRSTGGYLFMLSDGCITWSSK
uniref:CCHC-type domain-containing protein n=1 Tax=Trichogramma kaykai TaxID=54128 RepID=A0ABD2XH93_9HYME